MGVLRAAGFGLLVFVIFGRITSAYREARVSVSLPRSCSAGSITDSILGIRDSVCDVNHIGDLLDGGAVIEGDESSLQKALHKPYSHAGAYLAVLFYASWCPFSRTFRPSFSVLASLYPSISHFAIEESAIRPSVLSKYGVHGFPTLYLLNSTMRIRYRGSRSLDSVKAFYTDVTGIKSDHLMHQIPSDSIGCLSNEEKGMNHEQENCPFSWARSPENLLQQETYLALATVFLLLRLLYSCSPYLVAFSRFVWRGRMQNMRLGRWWEHPLAYVKSAVQLFKLLKDPCKRSNLQEGAINARTWASKSLASAVSIGDGSTSSRSMTSCESNK